ncbi:MAG TPA: hypothetical protein VGE67_20075, partial [Haloferula sp.]
SPDNNPAKVSKVNKRATSQAKAINPDNSRAKVSKANKQATNRAKATNPVNNPGKVSKANKQATNRAKAISPDSNPAKVSKASKRATNRAKAINPDNNPAKVHAATHVRLKATGPIVAVLQEEAMAVAVPTTRRSPAMISKSGANAWVISNPCSKIPKLRPRSPALARRAVR